MVEVIFEEKFKEIFLRIKDPVLKERIIKQVEKIKTNPEVGKPMGNIEKGTRELYISPFRLSYSYNQESQIVFILNLHHKDAQ